MRGAPHSGLAWLMRRIKSRISAATSGLPRRRRDLLVQYQAKARTEFSVATSHAWYPSTCKLGSVCGSRPSRRRINRHELPVDREIRAQMFSAGCTMNTGSKKSQRVRSDRLSAEHTCFRDASEHELGCEVENARPDVVGGQVNGGRASGLRKQALGWRRE